MRQKKSAKERTATQDEATQAQAASESDHIFSQKVLRHLFTAVDDVRIGNESVLADVSRKEKDTSGHGMAVMFASCSS